MVPYVAGLTGITSGHFDKASDKYQIMDTFNRPGKVKV